MRSRRACQFLDENIVTHLWRGLYEQIHVCEHTHRPAGVCMHMWGCFYIVLKKNRFLPIWRDTFHNVFLQCCNVCGKGQEFHVECNIARVTDALVIVASQRGGRHRRKEHKIFMASLLLYNFGNLVLFQSSLLLGKQPWPEVARKNKGKTLLVVCLGPV